MRTRSRSRRPVILIVAGLIVVALAAGAYIRYNGPVTTVRSYFNDLGQGNYTAAVALVCTAQQSDANNGLQLLKQFQARVDFSQVAYDLQDESLSLAHVRAHGNLTVSVSFLGQNVSTPTSLDTTIAVESSGIGWCMDSSTFTINPSGLGAITI